MMEVLGIHLDRLLWLALIWLVAYLIILWKNRRE